MAAKLRKKTSADGGKSLPNLERARALIKEERCQAAFDLLMRDPHARATVETQRLLGLACVRMGRHAEAVKHYEWVCARSGDPGDWFNLAMARLQGGDPVHGIIALEEAKRRYEKGKEEMAVQMMLFYFVGGLLELAMWDAAKRYLRELAETYVSLHQTGDQFLYARGMPYFSWFLNSVVTAHRGSNSPKEGIAWLTALAPKLEQEGRDRIAHAVRMLEEGKEQR